MSTKHDRTLEAIFAHPIAMNLKWTEVEHFFDHVGADVRHHGGRATVILNGEEMTFHVPHTKTLSSKDEVMQIRHFLERAGVTPAGA